MRQCDDVAVAVAANDDDDSFCMKRLQGVWGDSSVDKMSAL